MNKKVNKAEFGKGIRALLANPTELEQAVQDNPQEVARELANYTAMLPLEQIETNMNQPRTSFDEDALRELADSIRVHGLIQPITVRRLHDRAYQLISGERRFRASKMAGLEEIPAYIRLADDQQMLEMALIENIQREDLNAMEVAISYSRLVEEFNLTHDDLSERVGKKRSTITNYLRLLKLPDDVQTAIKAGDLTMGHARALAAVEDKALQISLAQRILREGLSVREVEKIIADYNTARSPAKTARSAEKLPSHLREIQDQFSAFFGTKVQLKRNEKGQGQLLVRFDNDDQLNRMLELIEKG